MGEIIKVKNLIKNFPVQTNFLDVLFAGSKRSYVHAVDDVSFSINEGEVFGLAGESGSGKSTIGRLLLHLIKPTSGEILFHGEAVSEMPEKAVRGIRKRIQVVFQDPKSSLSPRMRVGEAISHPLKIHTSLKPKERKQKVLELMEKVGLTPAEFLYNKYPHQLSGGQCQRIVLSRAMITNPEFIVADEPIAMADVSVRALILELMKKLKKEFSLTYLFITHDLSTAKYLCDRIAIMYLGRIIEIGETSDLFKNPNHPYTKALLAAVPVPDPSQRRTEEIPKGEISSAINPPSGCHFHPRCRYAIKKCREKRPELKEITKNHYSACYLNDK